MRKQTKLVAVLSAAALLAIGASMTSFAAKGWVEEGGQWYYYDNNGDYVTNDWKKSGNNWFWLGDDGSMVTDSIVEDGDYKYYVNANGAMVTNSWVAVEPGDDDNEDDAPDHYWYYFGANGKACKASDSSKGIVVKTINGKKYGFDRDSKMLYGWVSDEGEKITDESPFMDAMYYFGTEDDGAMHTDWLQYMDGSDESSTLSGKEYSDMDEMWFYFNVSNSKKVDARDDKDGTIDEKIYQKTIRGNKYGFDENGVMVYEWTGAGTPSQNKATKSGIKYFSTEDDGHLKKKTWIWAVPSETIDADDYDDDTYRWFYADATGTTYKSDIKKINGKKYLFDENGVMLSGLQWVTPDTNGYKATDDNTDDSDEIKAGLPDNADADLYYFGDEATDGSMKTGKNIKIELDDDTFTFAFKSNGKAYNYNRVADEEKGKLEGLTDSKIYINGLLIKANSDDRYTYIGSDLLEDGNEYLVGTSGTVVSKGKYVKDGDDNWWSVDKNGVVTNWGSDDESKDKARCQSKNTKDGTEENFTETTEDDGDVRVECK